MMTTSAEGALGAVSKVPPLWGDGLLDRSLASQWYPGTWDEVDLDELTFFMPGLTRHTSTAEGGPAAHLRAALARRVGVTLPLLAGYLKRDEGKDRKRLIELIEECAGLAPGSLREAIKTPSAADVPATVRTRVLRPLSAGERLEAIVYELSVLNCLGRMVQDCQAAGGEARTNSNARPSCSEADALVATIHSGVNAAYVYPHLAYAHETFAAGAWLGVLLSGRRALLPETIAARLAEVGSISRLSGRMPGQAQNATDVVLSYHAHLAVGHRRMNRLAHRALRRSRAPAVRARRPLFDISKRPWIWNDELCAAVARRLSPYLQSPVHLREERTCNVISAP